METFRFEKNKFVLRRLLNPYLHFKNHSQILSTLTFDKLLLQSNHHMYFPSPNNHDITGIRFRTKEVTLKKLKTFLSITSVGNS